MIEFYRVSEPDNVIWIWPKIKDYLQAALDEADGEFDIHDVYDMIAFNKIELYVGVDDKEVDCTFTITVDIYPQKKVMRIVHFGGRNKEKWLNNHFRNYLVKLAESLGCSDIDLIGREGWEKALKPFKFEKKGILMRMELGEK